MTREQAKQNLVTIGVSEPTDEQITNYLNQVSGETQRERTRADKYKADADKATDLQKQLDEINQQGLSDLEKANNRTAELEKQLKTMQQKQSLAELGIIGESADKLIKEDGSLDYAVLGQIITDRETKASSAKEQELLKNTPNPNGGSGGKHEEPEPADVANAKNMTFGSKASTDANKNYYVI